MVDLIKDLSVDHEDQIAPQFKGLQNLSKKNVKAIL